MPGAYCRYCDHRCFVDRVLPDTGRRLHMATCPAGKDHDRTVSAAVPGLIRRIASESRPQRTTSSYDSRSAPTSPGAMSGPWTRR